MLEKGRWRDTPAQQAAGPPGRFENTFKFGKQGSVAMRAKPLSVRELAVREAQIAFAYLARTFNYCENPRIPYKYSPEVQARFLELGSELARLIKEGEIVEANGARAQHDAAFQRFLARLNLK